MALSNESYIINTATVGEIIVPVNTTVPYLNVTLVGYQYYGYHQVVSQSLTNLADDVKALQDGGLAQATYDLDQMIADANAQITAQITSLESGLNDKIIFLTSEAVDNVNSQLSSFYDILNGAEGIVALVAINTQAIGDADSGLTQKVNTLETTIGDESSGIILQFNSLNSNVLAMSLLLNGGTDSQGQIITGLDDRVLLTEAYLNDPTIGVIPRVTSIEAVIGDTGSGMINDVIGLHDVVFGDGTYIGLQTIIGTSTTGMIKQVNDIETALNAEITSTDNRLDNVEGILGSTGPAGTGTLKDVENLQTEQGSIKSRVQINEGKLNTIDGYNIPAMINTASLLRDDIDNNTDVISSLVTASTSTNANIDTALGNLSGRIDDNDGELATIAQYHITLDADYYAAVTGTKALVANMDTHITSTFLTSGATVLNASKLVDEYTYYITQKNTLDLNTRFASYFGAGNNALPSNEIGKSYVDDWLAKADSVTTGYKYLTDARINGILDETNGVRDNIEVNATALALLNNTVSTNGSVAYIANTYMTSLDNSLNDSNGSITLLNSGASTTGSVASTATGIANTKISIYNINTVQPIASRTTAIESDIVKVREEAVIQTEELQVEMVRYDTILPFLQKMFKYVNNSGSITDAQIDSIFDDINTSITSVATSIINPQVLLGLNTTTSSFDIVLEIDRDQKFAPIPGAGPTDYVNIIRPADNFGNGVTLTAGEINSRSIIKSITNTLFANATDNTGVPINDLSGTNADIILVYATEDMFGQVTAYQQKIELV